MAHFNLQISEDKLIAKLSCEYDGESTRDVLVGEILLLLESKGIVHGVSESMIESAVDILIEKGRIHEAVVAVGDHPGKEGSNGPTFTVPFYSSDEIADQSIINSNDKIPYYRVCQLIDTPYIVKKNEVIGVDESWNSDEGGGVDIYGEPIKSYSGNSEIAILKEGISIDKKSGNIIALNTGILVIHHKSAKIVNVNIDGDIKIDISEDGINAYLTIYPASPQGNKLKITEVFEKLKSLGVVYGLKERVIESTFKLLENNSIPMENVLIAKGDLPQEGENEKIKYLVNLSFSGKPHLDEHGRADYFKIHIFENVKTGQPLAKIIPSSPGTDGKDIYGKTVPAEPVKKCDLAPGNNVKIHSVKKNVFVSAINGHVYLKKNQLVVEKVFRIDGNVDFRTGNINFEGDVDIKGDVPSGFTVRASGNIVVGGTVEDAFLRAEESIIIKGGFLGRGIGRVKAGKDVVVKHVMNQTIMAQNNIMIAGEAVDSKLYAGNEMFVEVKKSWIIGGWAVAGKKIYANAIGNVSGVYTEIFCGTNHFIRKILDEIAIEITLLEEEAATIKEKMRHPEINDEDMKNDEEFMESLSIQLKAIKNKQDVKYNKLKLFRSSLKEMNVDAQGEVGVKDTIYPGVVLHIGDLKYAVNDGMKQIIFYYSEDQIKMRPFN